MPVDAGTAYITFRPDLSGLEDELKKAVSPMATRLGDSLSKIGSTLTKTVTLPIVAFGAAGVKAAIDVDKGLREVNSLFGLTGKAAESSFKELKGGVAGLSKEIGVAQDVLVKGLYQALSAGVPRENAFTFMKVASKAAIAGVTDTETAVDGLTTIINAFGLKASDVERVADSMFTTVRGGKTTFAQLSDALFNIAPAAAAAGVSMEEVNAGIATLTASGVPTSVATTQLRAALTGLQRPSEDLNAIFQKLGFQNAQAAIESKGFAFALDAVRDAADGDSGKLQTLLGSVEAVAAANVIAGTGAAKMAAELDNQAKKAGANQRAFEEMEKSVGRKVDRLVNTFKNLAIRVGDALLPIVTKIGSTLAGVAEWFENLSPPMKRFAGTLLVTAAAVGPLLLVFGKIIKIGQAMKLMFATNPWAILIAATVALTLLIVQNWETIKNAIVGAWQFIVDKTRFIWQPIVTFFTTIFNAIKTTFETVWRAIDGFIVPLWNAWKAAAQLIFNALKAYFEVTFAVIKTVFETTWNAIKAVVVPIWEVLKATAEVVFKAIEIVIRVVLTAIRIIWESVWGSIRAFVLPIWEALKVAAGVAFNAIKAVIETVLKGIQAIWTPAWTAIKTVVTGIWNTIKTVVTTAVNAVKTVIQTVMGVVSGIWSKVWGAMGETVKGIWAGVISGIKAAVNTIIRIINGMIDGVNFAIGGLNKIPGVDIPKIPKIPSLADGGIVEKATLALIGEGRDKEAVIPLPKLADLLSLAQDTAGSASDAGNVTIEPGAVHVEFHDAGLTPEQVERIMSSQMSSLVRMLRAG